jgi:hypothetical protein
MQFGGAVGFSKEQQLKEEITYIQTHLKDQKLLTFYDFGGHLIFQTRGGVKVYVDGRERTAYPLSLIEDNILFMKSYGWGPGVRDMFARYGITALMIPKGMELEQHFRKNADWKLAFEGPNATIFSKVEYSHAR